MAEFIDMHCHIIPKVDDGSDNIDETVNMLRLAYEDGIRKIIATPHYHIGRMKADRKECEEQLACVKRKINEMGMDIEMYLGHEVYYFSEMMENVDNEEILPLANSSYILVEFEPGVQFSRILTAIDDVACAGYVPIIAHVERYLCLVGDIGRCDQLIERGALLQVNASSVVGKYGKDIQRFIKKMLKKRKISFVASDAHGADKRRPKLMEAYVYVKKKTDEEYADTIFLRNQLKIIADRRISVG